MACARSTRAQRHAGFTLVEVLVALLIMAVIAAMGWQGVASMARTREATEAAGERTLRLATLVAQWEQDIQSVYDNPLMAGIEFDGATLRLQRRVDDGNRGGVQVVAWSLRDGHWRRWASAATTRAADLQASWQLAKQLQGNEEGQLLLSDGVSDWQVYFWRGGGWSNAQSSGDVAAVVAVPVPVPAPEQASAPGGGASGPSGGASAPAAAPRAVRTLLPAGVRLQLTLPEGRLTRDVALSPQIS